AAGHHGQHREHVHDEELGTLALGECDGLPERRARRRGEVGGKDDPAKRAHGLGSFRLGRDRRIPRQRSPRYQRGLAGGRQRRPKRPMAVSVPERAASWGEFVTTSRSRSSPPIVAKARGRVRRNSIAARRRDERFTSMTLRTKK